VAEDHLAFGLRILQSLPQMPVFSTFSSPESDSMVGQSNSLIAVRIPGMATPARTFKFMDLFLG
jgi:hypothetical protein